MVTAAFCLMYEAGGVLYPFDSWGSGGPASQVERFAQGGSVQGICFALLLWGCRFLLPRGPQSCPGWGPGARP